MNQSTDQSGLGVLVDESFGRIEEQRVVNSASLCSYTVCLSSNTANRPENHAC